MGEEYGKRAFSGATMPTKKYKIKSCNATDKWYKNMIGQTIEVRLYGTFGAWDDNDRWLCHYDLEPIR